MCSVSICLKRNPQQALKNTDGPSTTLEETDHWHFCDYWYRCFYFYFCLIAAKMKNEKKIFVHNRKFMFRINNLLVFSL